MGIEKLVFSGKKALIIGSLTSSIILLSACESVLRQSLEVAEEVRNMSYMIATLPLKPFQNRREPSISENGCFEIPSGKVCRLYLSEEVYGAKEEYFGILKIKNNPHYESMILAYFDGDNYDIGGNKNLVVVGYKGSSVDDFVEPWYSKIDFSYSRFEGFFENPVKNHLNMDDNQLKRVMDKGLVSKLKLKILQERMHDKIRDALRLLTTKSKLITYHE
ncbi:hypothetical protein COU59_02990 [Candidatus Pacearchaeota archaeon CG10_big_fil_rev_8_21_14_0_10_34_12]|nr:MAG: hypothetical protein COU59_02990 [Candidatus Pacearchaeota archaeon CG10_big_fil_rev_8_21_14_0_10_34_12]